MLWLSAWYYKGSCKECFLPSTSYLSDLWPPEFCHHPRSVFICLSVVTQLPILTATKCEHHTSLRAEKIILRLWLTKTCNLWNLKLLKTWNYVVGGYKCILHLFQIVQKRGGFSENTTFVRMTVWSFPQEMEIVFFLSSNVTGVGTCLSGKRHKQIFC